MKLVITGSARSGTGFICQVLRGVGVTCGHEQVFHPKTRVANWASYQADASWLAVPHLRGIRASGAYVVHQVRDPIAVLRSLCGLELFSKARPEEDPYLQAMWRFDKAIFAFDDPLRRAMSYWIRWTMAAHAQADVTCRIEDLDAKVLQELCAEVGVDVSKRKCAEALASTDSRYNSRSPDTALTWATLPAEPLTELFRSMAVRYGY